MGAKKQQDITDLMIQKRLCISRAEARRLLSAIGEEKVKEKLNRIKIIKRK